MRADRLVATLLLLQARGTVTARQVAAELEVSERTARRDLEALSAAGIPVYSTRGFNGGWQLIGGARTDLTGLRASEAEALLMMAAVAGQSTSDFRSAIRKLTQALPDPIRADAQRAMASIVSDNSAWNNRAVSSDAESERTQRLDLLRRAIEDRTRVELVYDARKGISTRLVDPLGLITKRAMWYLLANTERGHRTFRLDQMRSITTLPQRFEPPEGFDLDAAWTAVTDRFDTYTGRTTTRALIDQPMIAALRAAGIEITLQTENDDGRHGVTLSAWTTKMLAEKLAGVITRVDLIDPPAELIRQLREIGAALVARFPDTIDHESQPRRAGTYVWS